MGTHLTREDIEKLEKIQDLLDEGLAHYLTYESHCKSSEGHVSVSFGNSWERRDGKSPVRVTVYSYVLSPERSTDFESVDEALEAVMEWHAEEMAYTPPEDYEEKMQELAADFIEAMGDRITIIEVGDNK